MIELICLVCWENISSVYVGSRAVTVELPLRKKEEPNVLRNATERNSGGYDVDKWRTEGVDESLDMTGFNFWVSCQGEGARTSRGS